MDLRELWRGDLTLRRLGVLVTGLPPESTTMSLLLQDVPDEPVDASRARRWSTDQQLLASVVDSITLLRYAYVSAHTKQRVPVPTLLTERSVTRAPRRRLSDRQLARIRHLNHGSSNGH